MNKTKKELGVIGLGKMGTGVALRARERGWRVVAHNRSREKTDAFVAQGGEGVATLPELVAALTPPRVLWVMLTAGEATEDTLLGENGTAHLLERGDIVIDAANSFYEDGTRRARALRERGVHFIDVGFSGGPKGAREGGALMVGGEKADVQTVAPLLADLAVPDGWLHCGESGAGHFVKMVHNGIEYGMMQSLAEGFAVLKHAPFPLDLPAIAGLYNRRSVIESRLVGWLADGFAEHGADLKKISGTVAHTGEGKWTVETAQKLGVPVASIALALQFRVASEKNPSYTGKLLSLLRNQFGGHNVA